MSVVISLKHDKETQRKLFNEIFISPEKHMDQWLDSVYEFDDYGDFYAVFMGMSDGFSAAFNHKSIDRLDWMHVVGRSFIFHIKKNEGLQ